MAGGPSPLLGGGTGHGGLGEPRTLWDSKDWGQRGHPQWHWGPRSWVVPGAAQGAWTQHSLEKDRPSAIPPIAGLSQCLGHEDLH